MPVLLFAGAARAADDPNLNCAAFGSEIDATADTVPDKDGFSAFSLAVVAVPKVNFVSDRTDKAGCPSTGASCVRKGYLLQGNVVLSQGRDNEPHGYTCVSFVDKKGNETDGWLPAASLKPYTAPLDWIGRWKTGTYGEIDIKRKSPIKAEASGSATYGQGDATHEGDIEGDIDTRNGTQAFAYSTDKDVPFAKATADDCAVVMRQLGPYLLVNDDINCGGANVTFAGIYTKR
jgi:hypothetical protein